MDEGANDTPRTWSLRSLVLAAPTKTLIAAGFLGLMWGPILASILDAADRVQQDDMARSEADRLDPLPVQRLDPLRQAGVPAAVRPSVTGQMTNVENTQALLRENDAALDELQSLTRSHGLLPGSVSDPTR